MVHFLKELCKTIHMVKVSEHWDLVITSLRTWYGRSLSMDMYKQEQSKKNSGLFNPSRQLLCTVIPISLRMLLNSKGSNKNNKSKE